MQLESCRPNAALACSPCDIRKVWQVTLKGVLQSGQESAGNGSRSLPRYVQCTVRSMESIVSIQSATLYTKKVGSFRLTSHASSTVVCASTVTSGESIKSKGVWESTTRIQTKESFEFTSCRRLLPRLCPFFGVDVRCGCKRQTW